MEKSQKDAGSADEKAETAKAEMNMEDLMKAIENGISEEEAKDTKTAEQIREFYESIKTALEKSKDAEAK